MMFSFFLALYILSPDNFFLVSEDIISKMLMFVSFISILNVILTKLSNNLDKPSLLFYYDTDFEYILQPLNFRILSIFNNKMALCIIFNKMTGLLLNATNI